MACWLARHIQSGFNPIKSYLSSFVTIECRVLLWQLRTNLHWEALW